MQKEKSTLKISRSSSYIPGLREIRGVTVLARGSIAGSSWETCALKLYTAVDELCYLGQVTHPLWASVQGAVRNKMISGVRCGRWESLAMLSSAPGA